ncbi:hypothetical protein ACFPRL_20750 [Pseudoclavibacter helvolus]
MPCLCCWSRKRSARRSFSFMRIDDRVLARIFASASRYSRSRFSTSTEVACSPPVGYQYPDERSAGLCAMVLLVLARWTLGKLVQQTSKSGCGTGHKTQIGAHMPVSCRHFRP